MRRKTTNTEVRWQHVKHLLPRGDAYLRTTFADLVSGSDGGNSAAQAGGGGRNGAGSPLPINPNDLLTATLKDASQQLDQWRTATQAQSDAVAQNTAALQLNTASHGKGSTAGGILNTASSFLGGGLGAFPLVSGLLGLFGGGHQAAPLLPKYLAPSSLRIQNSVNASGGSGPAVYDQFGMPRTTSSGAASPPPTVSQPHVTVNVQAMDSRSFLDHGFEIAGAVREAMLNLHSINDVVNEL